MGLHDAVVDDYLRVTFAELEWLDVVAFRDARARETHASVVETEICVQDLDPTHLRFPWVMYYGAISC